MLTTWIIAGVVLLLVELVVPGMVLGFLGASALLVAGLVWMGWTNTWVASLTAWFVISLVLLVTLRGLFQKLGGGEVDRQTLDDEKRRLWRDRRGCGDYHTRETGQDQLPGLDLAGGVPRSDHRRGRQSDARLS